MRWCLFAFALLQSTIGSAAIFGTDDRLPVQSRAAESRAVGTALYGQRQATAFLVDQCFAVTSQHLVSTVADPRGAAVSLTFGRFRTTARAVRAGHVEREQHGYRDDWLRALDMVAKMSDWGKKLPEGWASAKRICMGKVTCNQGGGVAASLGPRPPRCQARCPGRRRLQ